MNDVVEYITRKIGTEPVPYELEDFSGIKEPTNCLLWKLPLPTEEDKSILQLDSELTERLYELVKISPDSPEIEYLAKKRTKLLKGLKFSKRHGFNVYTPNDLMVLDKRKGIRKEWWNLRNYVKEKQFYLFLGYSSEMHELQKIADEIILMPAPDQYEYLRLHSTRGNNFPVETEDIIKRIENISKIVETTVLFAGRLNRVVVRIFEWKRKSVGYSISIKKDVSRY